MPVVSECKHNPKLYCKNWDGNGAPASAVVVCPANVKTCEYIVKPTPATQINSKGANRI